MARLKKYYEETIVKQLMEQFNYKSVMQVPRIEKITLNMGVGEAVADKKVMENAVSDLEKIAGQKPLVTKAKKSISFSTGQIIDSFIDPLGVALSLGSSIS